MRYSIFYFVAERLPDATLIGRLSLHVMVLKILHVVISLDPGGMENGLLNVANALSSQGFEFHVCCLERRGTFAGRLPQSENVSVLGKRDGFSWQAAFALRREIARIRPHLLHTHNLGPLIYGTLASGFGRVCPIVHGEHAELTGSDLSPRRLFQRRLLYRCCRKIHTVSQGMSQQLLKLHFPISKIVTIVNGVDTLRFAPADQKAARLAVGLPSNALVLGIVGRFGPFKRHTLLIDAFERLASRFPEMHLLIVGGGGPEESRIHERTRQSPAAERIHLAGFQSDTRSYYQSMNLLVVPSVNEGLSNAVLEAMACGVPALAHAACGNNEAITDGIDGIVADLDTVEQLEAKITEALCDRSKLAKMGDSARRRSVESFALEKMAAGYARLYRESAMQ